MAKVTPSNLYDHDDDSSGAEPPTVSEAQTVETVLDADFK